MVRDTPVLVVALAWALVALSACSTKKVVVAEQCPSPATGEAEVKGETDVNVFGTTCAPCDDEDRPEFDDDGCPIYVTFDSCGGDICIGRLQVTQASADGGVPDGGVPDGEVPDGEVPDGAMVDGGDDDDAGSAGADGE